MTTRFSVEGIPHVPYLSASRSKRDFFKRLSLSEENNDHVALYDLMKKEAVAGRNRLSQNESNLALAYQQDSRVVPPYSSTHMTETAVHREVLTIYRYARSETRPYYNLGRYIKGGIEENWVIRWTLWHAFRYRDNRNRCRQSRTDKTTRNDADLGEESDYHIDEDNQRGVHIRGVNEVSIFYDPIRDM